MWSKSQPWPEPEPEPDPSPEPNPDPDAESEANPGTVANPNLKPVVNLIVNPILIRVPIESERGGASSRGIRVKHDGILRKCC